jgi:hypothetical protein
MQNSSSYLTIFESDPKLFSNTVQNKLQKPSLHNSLEPLMIMADGQAANLFFGI